MKDELQSFPKGYSSGSQLISGWAAPFSLCVKGVVVQRTGWGESMVDSHLTFIVAAVLLRQVGCIAVYPLTLAMNSSRTN